MIKKISLKQVTKWLPKKTKTYHKNLSGRSLIIGGSHGLYGAGVLSATASSRVGSGYTILMTDLKNKSLVKHPEFLTADYNKDKISKINFDAVGIGPGLGTKNLTYKLLKELIKIKAKNVVVDADALSVIAQKKIFPLPSTWILTPHEGEMSRLLMTPSQKVKNNRLESLKTALKKYKCLILLKGHHTLIGKENNVFEIQTGNQALAKAGTGDVLTGMITGFLAQGVQNAEAALLAATVHGSLADQWVKEKKDILSLMPTDLTEMLPKFLSKLRK